jgi:hypothetical protein
MSGLRETAFDIAKIIIQAAIKHPVGDLLLGAVMINTFSEGGIT